MTDPKFGMKGKLAGLTLALLVVAMVALACTSPPPATSSVSPAATAVPAPIVETPVPAATQSPPENPTAASAEPSDTPLPTEAAPVESVGVASEIRNFALETLTVPVGTTVTWTNRDGAAHTATSGTPQALGGIWDSGVLSREDSFDFTFNEIGDFPYFCAIHNSMRGIVTVTQ